MERKNDSTILLLLAAGFGVYWLTRKKTTAMDQVSTQPVLDQPITEMPVFNDISTQPIYEQPIYAAPIIEQPVYMDRTTQPIYEQPIYAAPIIEQQVQNIEFTPVTDMFNTVWQPDYVEKTVIDPVYNMNIEAL
jgi:hypothetical protein